MVSGMVSAFRPNASKPSPGSWLDKQLSKRARHPDEFDCGVRVLEGAVARQGRRWRFRRSAVDLLITDGWVTLQHGLKSTLHLSVDPTADGPGPRPGHVVLRAVERDSGAVLQLSVDRGVVERFGIELG